MEQRPCWDVAAVTVTELSAQGNVFLRGEEEEEHENMYPDHYLILYSRILASAARSQLAVHQEVQTEVNVS